MAANHSTPTPALKPCQGDNISDDQVRGKGCYLPCLSKGNFSDGDPVASLAHVPFGGRGTETPHRPLPPTHYYAPAPCSTSPPFQKQSPAFKRLLNSTSIRKPEVMLNGLWRLQTARARSCFLGALAPSQANGRTTTAGTRVKRHCPQNASVGPVFCPRRVPRTAAPPSRQRKPGQCAAQSSAKGRELHATRLPAAPLTRVSPSEPSLRGTPRASLLSTPWPDQRRRGPANRHQWRLFLCLSTGWHSGEGGGQWGCAGEAHEPKGSGSAQGRGSEAASACRFPQKRKERPGSGPAEASACSEPRRSPSGQAAARTPSGWALSSPAPRDAQPAAVRCSLPERPWPDARPFGRPLSAAPASQPASLRPQRSRAASSPPRFLRSPLLFPSHQPPPPPSSFRGGETASDRGGRAGKSRERAAWVRRRPEEAILAAGLLPTRKGGLWSPKSPSGSPSARPHALQALPIPCCPSIRGEM